MKAHRPKSMNKAPIAYLIKSEDKEKPKNAPTKMAIPSINACANNAPENTLKEDLNFNANPRITSCVLSAISETNANVKAAIKGSIIALLKTTSYKNLFKLCAIHYFHH